MKAILLTVGDEILIGQTANTNATWIGERLALAGIDVVRTETVGDDEKALRAALTRAYRDASVVLVTGGLGPTHDDITKEVVAGFWEAPLVLDHALLQQIDAWFSNRGRPMPESNKALAYVPEGFEVLRNPKGTAPGLWGSRDIDSGDSAQSVQLIALLPGVPHEMQAIVKEHVLPRLQRMTGDIVLHKTLCTAGRGESHLSERLGDLPSRLGEETSLAFLPSLGTVRLRLTVRGSSRQDAQEILKRETSRIRDLLGDDLYGEDDVALEEALGTLLVQHGCSLAVAESCTGGAIAARIVQVAGASRYFRGGVVAYSNGVKNNLLALHSALIERHGAVSEEVARAMAAAVREKLGADIGVATTGVAGPGGGTAEKPVGTLWLGFADETGTHAVHRQLTHDRSLNIGLSTTAALDLMRRQLLRRGDK